MTKPRLVKVGGFVLWFTAGYKKEAAPILTQPLFYLYARHEHTESMKETTSFSSYSIKTINTYRTSNQFNPIRSLGLIVF